MRRARVRNGGQQAFSLVEMLVVCLILVALSAITATMLLRTGASKGAPLGKAHSPIERAHDTECMNNIHQVKLGLLAAQAGDPDGRFPQSLTELKLPAEMLTCPVGKMPYMYDPNTGQAHCPYPGHENFQ